MRILYIDPGTGSMLFAVILGIASTVFFLAQKFWIKLKFILTSGRVKDDINARKIPLVIFGEDGRYWNHFHGVCDELEHRGIDCEYFTMDKSDPILETKYEHIHPLFIGEGNKAFAKLNLLKAKVLYTTTPGLEVYQWKRSPNVDKYVHIYHGVDEGTGYRMFGMDFFDSLFLASDFQAGYIRKLEELREEDPHEITIVGSPYLDELKKRADSLAVNDKDPSDITVLVAPSWGDSAILYRFGDELLDALVKTGYHIIVRPHPQSLKTERHIMDPLIKKYPDNDQIEWDYSNDVLPSLSRADVMISDFSTVVLDYTLIFNKPVIIADPYYDKAQYDSAWIDEEVWRIRILDQLGISLKREDFPKMKEKIDYLTECDRFKESRDKLREQVWTNQGKSAKIIADYLESQLKAG